MQRTILWTLALIGSAVAGCAAPRSAPEDTSTPLLSASSSTSAGASAALEAFPPGIYYVDPARDQPGSPLVRLHHVPEALARPVRVHPNLYDLDHHRVISSDSRSSLRIETANQTTRTVRLEGLYAMGRPTFSADGVHAAVQAVDDPSLTPSPGVAASYAIYVADLRDGAHHRVSSTQEKCESPKWIPATTQVLFSCFQPDGPGMPKVHVVESSSGVEVRTLTTIGTLMPGVSKDGRYLLQPELLRVWDLSSGALAYDLKDEALAGLRAAGYDLDAAHDGFGHRGSFPLDGDFSPDGTAIVFDGAVTKAGDEGILVMRMGLDGTGFQVLAGIIHANPQETNNYNYSPVNPRWLS